MRYGNLNGTERRADDSSRYRSALITSATVGALSAMTGIESQLKAHLGISMNTGLSRSQLAELVPFFEEKGEENDARRLQMALDIVQAH
ncbi:hypothetical protein [Mixta calida]|uniref:hypothetical protein n=1 Tax=Mixta calida TaxID=665913 RepID=UPI00403A9E4F